MDYLYLIQIEIWFNKLINLSLYLELNSKYIYTVIYINYFIRIFNYIIKYFECNESV